MYTSLSKKMNKLRILIFQLSALYYFYPHHFTENVLIIFYYTFMQFEWIVSISKKLYHLLIAIIGNQKPILVLFQGKNFMIKVIILIYFNKFMIHLKHVNKYHLNYLPIFNY